MNKSEKRTKDMVKIEDGNQMVQPTVTLSMVLADLMDAYTIAVYYELASHQGMYGDCLSQRQIANALKIGQRRVIKSLQALEDFGVIERHHNKDESKPDVVVLKDIDKAWELNPTGKGYSRTWRWKLKKENK